MNEPADNHSNHTAPAAEPTPTAGAHDTRTSKLTLTDRVRSLRLPTLPLLYEC